MESVRCEAQAAQAECVRRVLEKVPHHTAGTS